MKKLTKFLGIYCLTLCLMPTPRAKAWGTKIHYFLMDRALNIVSCSSPRAGRFNNQKIDIEMLYKGVVEPIEKKYNPDFHYYQILTGFEKMSYTCNKALMNKQSYGTARTRLDYHYQKALMLYLEGELSRASLHLGSACHYLQDICCPSHTTTVDEEYNAAYNKYCDKVATALVYEPIKVTDKDVKKLSDKWDEVISKNTKIAASYKKALLSKQKTEWQESFVDTFNLSQRQTAALLIKFYQDVQKKKNVEHDIKILSRNELEAALFETFRNINKNSYSKNIDQCVFDTFDSSSQQSSEKDSASILESMLLIMDEK